MAKASDESGVRPKIDDTYLNEVLHHMDVRTQLILEQCAQRDAVLQEKFIDLFSRLLDASSLDRVLVAGFSEVSDQLGAQLAPLRELARQYTPLSDEDDARLASLRRALERPNFSGPAPEDTVPMIGRGVSRINTRSFAP